MIRQYRYFIIAIILLLAAPIARADSDQTLSPYFAVKADDGVDALPLLSTKADVRIAGVIADVAVTQVYKNDGTVPLEAIYIFPGSTRSAVYGMKMTIGERVRVAKIKERTAAKQIYTKAKQAGKSASLLEQHRPNVFQMSVANIMPGDRIEVELRYTEFLVPDGGVYEFVYPTVVGPRYSNDTIATTPPSEHWIANPYLREGEKPTSTFDLTAEVQTGIPLQDLASPSHEVDIRFEDENRASVALARQERNGGNRDFILRYRLEGARIEAGLLLYEGSRENYFLAMIQPPERVTANDIPPREFVFVVDVSGSMYGFPLDITKDLMQRLLSNLAPNDSFNVILFSGRSSLLSPTSLPATDENIRKASYLISQQQGGGGTELLPALERALAIPQDENRSRTIVIVTDGYIAADDEAISLIRQNLGRANVFPFGIGSSVNRHLIEGLARAGFGEPFVITQTAEAADKAEKFRTYVQTPVLTDIQVEYDGFDTYDVEPLSIPDVFAERPVIIFGKYRGPATGKIRLFGASGNGEYTRELDVSRTMPSESNSALRYLWARHQIALASDRNFAAPTEALVQRITSLGLQYNLLTKYTSFVAVDEVLRNPDGSPRTVKQPLPLPKGVSNLAVGGEIPTAPEPSLIWLLSATLALLGFWAKLNRAGGARS